MTLTLPRLRWGTATDRGMLRKANEDSLLANGTVFVVADGMGGHRAGDVASRRAVEAFARASEGRQVLTAEEVRGSVEGAHREIQAIDEEGWAGTTVSGMVIVEQYSVPYWLVLNVGDSRTYLWSQEVLSQVSVDHSEVQELVEEGTLTATQAETHPRRHVITRALGGPHPPEADYWYLPILPGSRLLVCSDGLTGEVGDARIAQVLHAAPDPQTAADALVADALAGGGKDNVTVVVVEVLAEDADASVDVRTNSLDADDDTAVVARVPVQEEA